MTFALILFFALLLAALVLKFLPVSALNEIARRNWLKEALIAAHRYG